MTGKNLFKGTSTASALSGIELVELAAVDGPSSNVAPTVASYSVYNCSDDKLPSDDGEWGFQLP